MYKFCKLFIKRFRNLLENISYGFSNDQFKRQKAFFMEILTGIEKCMIHIYRKHTFEFSRKRIIEKSLHFIFLMNSSSADVNVACLNLQNMSSI